MAMLRYVHHSSLRAARRRRQQKHGQAVTHLWRDCSSVSSHLFARKSQRGRSRTKITHRKKQHSATTILCEEACVYAAICTRRHNLAKRHLACGSSLFHNTSQIQQHNGLHSALQRTSLQARQTTGTTGTPTELMYVCVCACVDRCGRYGRGGVSSPIVARQV
jgi:hypothetical protein